MKYWKLNEIPPEGWYWRINIDKGFSRIIFLDDDGMFNIGNDYFKWTHGHEDGTKLYGPILEPNLEQNNDMFEIKWNLLWAEIYTRFNKIHQKET